MQKQHAIAIIDSGVGGLTVAREVMRQLPQEQIIYFGDNARCPYGSRDPEEIRYFCLQMVDFLSQYPLKALVIACNTATAVALEDLRERLNIPVLGVIEPGARAALSASRSGRIGVIGTETTIRTAAYERALRRIHPELYVVGKACPAFVPLVEQQLQHTEEAVRIVKETLAPLHQYDLDTLILGCTHYPLLTSLIAEAMGETVTLISSAEETARELSMLLSLQDSLATARGDGVEHHFYTSGDDVTFRNIGEAWFGCHINVQRKILEKAPNF
ncbi:glutamate racemase [Brevibacillus fulvus]|uniref:Glutamate racemase n=1 Tax=Brevibacillus fulvus TaxID=1125967 RepID=A0A938Y1U8_9BACL|nr:glutamate racemase [Brevibacillus fulvus]MBM7590067.1 glutamate racemase [Brevibacillus fulvus]